MSKQLADEFTSGSLGRNGKVLSPATRACKGLRVWEVRVHFAVVLDLQEHWLC